MLRCANFILIHIEQRTLNQLLSCIIRLSSHTVHATNLKSYKSKANLVRDLVVEKRCVR